jgi:DNA gyrase subunit A
MAKMIMKELNAFKKEYGRARRTVVDNLAEAVVVEKPIEEKDVVFLMDRFGYAKTIDVSIYERNKETAEAENKYVFVCRNTDKICVFTNTGQLHLIKVLDLPAGRLKDQGTPIDNLSNDDSKTENYINVTSLLSIASNKVVFGTKQSMIKLVDGSEFVVGKKTTAATKLADGDEVLVVRSLKGNETMVMRSEKECFLRIECATIPEKKKSAVGVRGMKLDKNDELKNIYVLSDGENEMVEVKGKEFALNRLHIGNRDTKGVKK